MQTNSTPRSFSLLHSGLIGDKFNTTYAHEVIVTAETDMIEAAARDHVAAHFEGNIRSNAGFAWSDCVVMDIDNDHSEQEQDWIDPEGLVRLLPDVEFWCVNSRSNMAQKGDFRARPRFHVYFPIAPEASIDAYVNLKRSLASYFDFFDEHALDAARFIFGVSTPQVFFHKGEITLDEWVAERIYRNLEVEGASIAEGSRNATLSRYAACVLIRHGVSDQARLLFQNKAELCEPPLDTKELESIWRSATKFAAKVAADPAYITPEEYESLMSIKPEHFTDVDQASVLALEYANKLAFSPATGWMVFNGSYWEESETAAQGVAQELTDRQLKDAQFELDRANDECTNTGVWQIMATSTKNQALSLMSKQQRQAYERYTLADAYKKYVLKRREWRAINSTMKTAQPMLLVRPQELDAHPYLLNTPSATYDLRLGLSSARAAYPLDRICKCTSTDVGTEGAALWQDALNTFFCGDTELIAYVQRICGLVAIGKVMTEAIIIAYGDGSNGKSTFWNTIARVLGSYTGHMPADALTTGVKRNIQPELAEAKGVRLLISAESEEGVRFSTSTVKQLASTDDIAAAKKYKDPFFFKPSHTLVLYTNHLPKVGAMDKGIWRRLIVIPFEATIEGTQDKKNYADVLFDKAKGAVLSWIMEGARLIHAEDYQLKEPRVVADALAAYKEEQDWFKHFLEEECCEVEPSQKCRSGELYQSYRSWALSSSEYVRSTTDFYTALERAGFERHKTMSGIMVFGLKPKTGFEL